MPTRSRRQVAAERRSVLQRPKPDATAVEASAGRWWTNGVKLRSAWPFSKSPLAGAIELTDVRQISPVDLSRRTISPSGSSADGTVPAAAAAFLTARCLQEGLVRIPKVLDGLSSRNKWAAHPRPRQSLPPLPRTAQARIVLIFRVSPPREGRPPAIPGSRPAAV
jgi:hypothetical protein